MADGRAPSPADLTDRERAFLADRELAPVLRRLAAHAEALARAGWSHADAEATLLGRIVLPLTFGHADGALNRRVRAGIDAARRAEGARLARRLAEMLDAIAAEPLPPDEVLSVASIVPFPDRLPSYVLTDRPAEALRRLAAGLERPPDLGASPGLASRKPSWRDALREAEDALADLGLVLREAEAVALARALARAGGVHAPTRDAVRAARRQARTVALREGSF
ncbi:hypothetical protein [Elioraea tepidiphila]|uniref:hypothetical protein n=1 Tax=Elioraea tepidiphila TaxID=457934 RepID=UPI00036448D3|nr:hypothetical protein [Elioraea tepidiphila]